MGECVHQEGAVREERSGAEDDAEDRYCECRFLSLLHFNCWRSDTDLGMHLDMIGTQQYAMDWNSEYVPSRSCLGPRVNVMTVGSPGRLQLLRHRHLRLRKTSHLRHHLPGHRPVHALTVPSRHVQSSRTSPPTILATSYTLMECYVGVEHHRSERLHPPSARILPG